MLVAIQDIQTGGQKLLEIIQSLEAGASEEDVNPAEMASTPESPALSNDP
jgi:hypothetical protein